MVKSVCFFQNRNKLIAKWIVSGCQIFLNLACSQNIRSQNKKFQNSLISSLHSGYASDFGYCILGVYHGKSLVPAFVVISVDGLFDNFGKSWISHPKICSNPLTCTVRTNICFGGHCVCEHCSVDEVGVTGREYWRISKSPLQLGFTSPIAHCHAKIMGYNPKNSRDWKGIKQKVSMLFFRI